MKIFVTGSTGFLGSHFVKAALKKGHSVTANGRSATKSAKLAYSLGKLASSSLFWHHSDLPQITEDHLRQHDVLAHFAAYGVSPQPCTWEHAFQTNVTDSISLLSRAIAAGIRRFVICGSCMEYGRSADRYNFIPKNAPMEPIGPYAASKAAFSLAAESLCRTNKITLIILRPFNVYGEDQHPDNFWPSLKRAAKLGKDFPMTLGEQIRDFIHVDQVAERFVNAVERELLNGTSIIENLGSGRPQSLKTFAEFWWKKWNAKGSLLIGALPYRTSEVMRYVPKL